VGGSREGEEFEVIVFLWREGFALKVRGCGDNLW
jgi:hypothetical protein